MVWRAVVLKEKFGVTKNKTGGLFRKGGEIRSWPNIKRIWKKLVKLPECA